MANSVDLDEVAHCEPPHPDLRCLRIQIFSSLVLKVVVVVLLFYVHDKHLRSCGDGQ